MQLKETKLHAVKVGRGPNVVMVHGLATNLSFWYMRIVQKLCADYQTMVYDLRGHGLSGMPRTGYTTQKLAGDLLHLLDAEGIRKAHLVGHSLGAAVALHFAALNPERVKSLSLIDCRLHLLQPFQEIGESRYWEERRQKLEEQGIPVNEKTPRIVYAMLEEMSQSRGNAYLFGGRKWNPASRTAKRWQKLVTSTSFLEDIREEAGLTRDVIGSIRVPVLLAYGKESFCLDTCRAFEKLLPKFQTVLHDGVGHFFPTTAPQLVVQDLTLFWSHLERTTHNQQESFLRSHA